MVYEIIILLLFLVILIFQLNRIWKIVVYEKKDIVMYLILISGAILIMGIIIRFGEGIFHYLIGGIGILILLLSIHIFGITKDSIIYDNSVFITGRAPGIKRFIGSNVKFENLKYLKVEEKSKEIIIKFGKNNTEKIMKFKKKDYEKIKKIINS